MTHNQLALQQNKIESAKAWENARHNKISEALSDYINQETKRHNVATELETNRHQKQMEYLEESKNIILNYQAVEQKRHNEAIEEIQRNNIQVEYYKAQENARHNRIQESINAQLAANDTRKVSETVLHNRNTEAIEGRKATADAAYKNAAARNSDAQAKLNAAKTTTEEVMRTVNSVSGWEGIILRPFESLSKQFNDYASGLGSIARGASSVINAIN